MFPSLPFLTTHVTLGEPPWALIIGLRLAALIAILLMLASFMAHRLPNRFKP